MADVNIRLNAKDNTKGVLKSFKSNVGNLATSFASLGGILTGGALVAGFSKFGMLAQTQQGAVAKLNNIVRQLGGDYEGFSKQVLSATSALQDKTVYGDEAQIAALTSLITITGDYQGSLKQLPQLLDFATSANMDLQSATRLYGRAIEGDISALTRYFPMVKSLQSEGKSAAEIMDAVTKRTEGSAEAFGKTQPLTQFMNVLGDIGEVIGGVLLPIFIPLTQAVKKLSTPFVELATGLGSLITLFSDTAKSSDEYSKSLTGTKGSTEELTDAQKKLNKELDEYQTKIVENAKLRINLGAEGMAMSDAELENFKKNQAETLAGIEGYLNKVTGTQKKISQEQKKESDAERAERIKKYKESKAKEFAEDKKIADLKLQLGRMENSEFEALLNSRINSLRSNSEERLALELELKAFKDQIAEEQAEKDLLKEQADLERLQRMAEAERVFAEERRVREEELAAFFQQKNDEMVAGFQLAVDSMTTALSTFTEVASVNFIGLFDKSVDIAKEVGRAWKNLFASLVRQIIAAIAKALVLQIILSATGLSSMSALRGLSSVGNLTGGQALGLGIGNALGFQTPMGTDRVIPGGPGEAVPIIAHGGERIGRGGSGLTINFNSAVFNADETASQITTMLRDYKNRTGEEI